MFVYNALIIDLFGRIVFFIFWVAQYIKKFYKMSEKDVVYAIQMLHVIQAKKNAIEFAGFISEKFSLLSKADKEKIYMEFMHKANK